MISMFDVRRLIDRLEMVYDFHDQGGPLRRCVDWQQLKATIAELSELRNPFRDPAELGCMDCGMPYREFPLDLLVPRGQWLAIHPGEDGVLCANCMVRRASRLPGAVVVHAVIERVVV